jgi:hypothetical protein
VMNEAVDRGEGHGGVGEDLAPFSNRSPSSASLLGACPEPTFGRPKSYPVSPTWR